MAPSAQPTHTARGPRLNVHPAGRRFYGDHRSGIMYGIQHLQPLHHPCGTLLDAFVDIHFISGDADRNTRHLRPWIGIIHIPHELPPGYTPFQSNEAIFSSTAWQESLPHCLGLFTMSEYHCRALRDRFPFPVESLLLPTETPRLWWSWEHYSRNPRKSIVQIGWWLRELHAIYRLNCPSHHKVFLRAKQSLVESLLAEEREALQKQGLFHPGMYSDTETVYFLENDRYDRLLAENIVFLKLHGASANNAVVECMVRATPLLVNPLEAVVEYLGPEYPLYYNDLEEAARKAASPDLLRAAHEYLLHAPRLHDLSGKAFRERLEASAIHRGLPAAGRSLMFTVITPIGDDSAAAAAVVRNVQSQHHPTTQHLLVGTPQALAALPAPGPGTIHLATAAPADSAAVLNQGLAAATGDAVLFLQPGQSLCPGVLKRVEKLLFDGAVGVIGHTRETSQPHAPNLHKPSVKFNDMMRLHNPTLFPIHSGACVLLRPLTDLLGPLAELPPLQAWHEYMLRCAARFSLHAADDVLLESSRRDREEIRAAIPSFAALPSYLRPYFANLPAPIQDVIKQQLAHPPAPTVIPTIRGRLRNTIIRLLSANAPGRKLLQILRRWIYRGDRGMVIQAHPYSDHQWENGVFTPERNLFLIASPTPETPAGLRVNGELHFSFSGRARIRHIGVLHRETIHHWFVRVDRMLDPHLDGFPHPIIVIGVRRPTGAPPQ